MEDGQLDIDEVFKHLVLTIKKLNRLIDDYEEINHPDLRVVRKALKGAYNRLSVSYPTAHAVLYPDSEQGE